MEQIQPSGGLKQVTKANPSMQENKILIYVTEFAVTCPTVFLQPELTWHPPDHCCVDGCLCPNCVTTQEF